MSSESQGKVPLYNLNTIPDRLAPGDYRALVPLAGTDLCLALCGIFRIFFGNFRFEQTRTQHGERARFILLLRTLIRAAHDQPRRFMNNLNR